MEGAASAEYWRNLGLRVDDEEFREAGAEARSLAVAITGVGDLRLLQGFKDAVAKGLERDLSADEVRERLAEELGPKSPEDIEGTDSRPWRVLVCAFDADQEGEVMGRIDLEIRTAMSRARHAGLWREVHLKALGGGVGSLLQYSADLRGGACEGHRSLHGLVRPHDDPVWRRFLPPNGLGCGCTLSVVDPSRALAIGLAPTSDGKLAEMLAGLRGDARTGFAPAEDPLLAIADALTWKYKNSEHTSEQHRRNAVEWEGFPELGAALRKRYESGVDVFAVVGHDVSSRSEMSLDIAVLPSHMPRNMAGRVVLVTDTGYKVILRELVRKLRNRTDRRFSSEQNSESEVRAAARMIMKSVLSGMLPGNVIAATMTELYVGTASDKVWIKFEHSNDSEHGQYYKMSGGLFIYDFDFWTREIRRHNKSFGVHKIKGTPTTRRIQ